MNDLWLLKGFEVELFTGTFSGENVGVSSAITEDLLDFVKEPDQRNLEYITVPDHRYAVLKHALLLPRQKLRKWLECKKLTILPGSTLSLGNTNKFERSDSENLYHSFIEKNYGTNVVTASIHINLGIEISLSVFGLALSAFFSGVEIAFVSANKLKLELDRSDERFTSKILAYFSKNLSPLDRTDVSRASSTVSFIQSIPL